MRRTLACCTLALMAGATGCARGPAVSVEGLPLRRVVIYRNGVGYFERSGHIEADKIHFKVKRSEVGDFLASLAVIERGGSSVRSASFPIAVQKDEPRPPRPLPAEEVDRDAAREGSDTSAAGKPQGDKLETVVLDLDGKAHDLQIGYIAETPVWRPSYRLVIGDKGSDLQAWGIVQNLSGEDWSNVRLSLIAGAPLAFEATLDTPVIPPRPRVTDSGEVIAAVPRSETSLNQEPMPPPPAPVAAPAPVAPAEGMLQPEADTDAEDEKKPAKKMGGARGRPKTARMEADKPAGKAMPARPMASSAMRESFVAPAPANPSGPRNLSALAAVAVEGGATRYDLPSPINVPDQSATMVMLLSKHVSGESIYLFAPDPGVPDSQSHPFRVARFKNESGGLLERGPIAIFEQGAFLGQGMVEPLPEGATTTVPFALERSLALEIQRQYDEEGARIARIESGTLVIERDAVARTRYRVKNGGDKPIKLLVKHPRNTQARLYNPPKGTEDNVGTASALLPVEAAAHGVADLTVDERQATQRAVDWLSPEADDAVRLFMADKRAEPSLVAALRDAWDVRTTLVRALEEQKKLVDERNELERSTEETRKNLKTLEKNRTAADLRTKLTDRLAKNSLRLEEITRRLIELDLRINEQRVRFTDAVRSIKLLDPPKPDEAPPRPAPGRP